MNEIKFIFKNAKYILPFLTLLSLCKLVLFYSLFNINISEYILVEEFLTPFVKDILTYLFFFLVPLILMIILLGDKIGASNLTDHKAIAALPFKTRLGMDLKRNWFFLILWFALIVWEIISKTPVEFILGTITFYPLISLTFWIRREIIIKHNISFEGENPAIMNLSIFIIFFFCLTISNTFSDVYWIKKGKEATRIICNNYVIDCKDSLAYIGRTKEFTFIYNKITKQTTAINNKEIKEVIK